MITIYELKPRFQALLRPMVRRLAATGVTANGVTLLAMLISIALGALLVALGTSLRSLFLLLPLWMLLRMALNAVDGMLAREFDQKSALGAYLNELSDVVSDAALYLPFVFVAPFGWASVGAVIFLSALSEMAGALAPMVGAERRYDGPVGKSDRAFVFGALGLWVGLMPLLSESYESHAVYAANAVYELPAQLFWIMPALSAGILFNTFCRVKNGVKASLLLSQKEAQ